MDILPASEGVVLRDCAIQKPAITSLLQYYASVCVRDSWGPLREAGTLSTLICPCIHSSICLRICIVFLLFCRLGIPETLCYFHHCSGVHYAHCCLCHRNQQRNTECNKAIYLDSHICFNFHSAINCSSPSPSLSPSPNTNSSRRSSAHALVAAKQWPAAASGVGPAITADDASETYVPSRRVCVSCPG